MTHGSILSRRVRVLRLRFTGVLALASLVGAYQRCESQDTRESEAQNSNAPAEDRPVSHGPSRRETALDVKPAPDAYDKGSVPQNHIFCAGLSQGTRPNGLGKPEREGIYDSPGLTPWSLTPWSRPNLWATREGRN